ncbi:MAG: flavodoxin domain-containing protein [Candidatus Bathyarchaeia archaeon]
MPKIVIVYESMSGNTEKMAKAVAEGASSIKGVDVEIYKVGTRFPVSSLDKADAIIVGSPTVYGNTAPEMREFLTSLANLKKSGRVLLKNKIGGVFGSYGWDGGWVVDALAESIKSLGVTVIPPIVSAADQMGGMGIRVSEDKLEQCRELGRNVARRLTQF